MLLIDRLSRGHSRQGNSKRLSTLDGLYTSTASRAIEPDIVISGIADHSDINGLAGNATDEQADWMKKKQRVESKANQRGGGGSLSDKLSKTDCAFPPETSPSSPSSPKPAAKSIPKPFTSTYQPARKPPTSLTTASNLPPAAPSIRPFSRQFGRNYHLVSDNARQILHSSIISSSLLPIGHQPPLDPVNSAEAIRLLDEAQSIATAIHWHESYFPKREAERTVMRQRLEVAKAAYSKFMKDWIGR